MSEAELRNALDKTVEQLMRKMEKRTFVEAFPPEVSRELLISYHGRLQELIKPKLSRVIEEKLEEFQVVKKLEELDKVMAETQHPRLTL